MFGRGFGRGFGRRQGGRGFGRGYGYGPGFARRDWRFDPAADFDFWGAPPPWARRWGIDLPPAERKAWLLQAKTHLQQRLAEIENELAALEQDAPPSES